MGEKNNSSTADRELKISRVLNAPIELVWKVWTEPEHIAQWWGPNGFTNTINTMDVKPGGEWKFVMHGPDGKDYNNRSIFKEIVRHERIVFEHFNPNFITTINFKAEGNKTVLNWQMMFETPEEFQNVVKVFKADEGIKQNVEKLEKYLSNQ
ncbi:MAG: SRPBCC domain-containing protein [Bacteroidetes bacterium]|nr:SRPBCC domain-containing protein [Bacteroidota bacterium]